MIPCRVKEGISQTLNWIKDEGASVVKNADDIQSALTPLLSMRSLPKSKNPWVVVELRWHGVYADIEEDYLCKLRDWLFVCSCVEQFSLGDRAGKHSEVDCVIAEHYQVRWATDEEIKYHGRDTYYWSLFKSEETPRYNEEAEAVLKHAYNEWATEEFDPEEDIVPEHDAFKECFDEAMQSVPCRGVVIVKDCLDYGQKGYSGSPRFDDARIEFNDMRKAALMVLSESSIQYTQFPNRDTKTINFGLRTKIETHFDDNSWGYKSNWNPDPRQWAQMQEECPPRCTWKDMLAVAQSVVKQKRLKRDENGQVRIH